MTPLIGIVVVGTIIASWRAARRAKKPMRTGVTGTTVALLITVVGIGMGVGTGVGVD